MMGRGQTGRVALEKERERQKTELHELVKRERELRHRLEELQKERKERAEEMRRVSREARAQEAAWEGRKIELETRIQALENQRRWQERRLSELERQKNALIKEEKELFPRLDALRSRLEELEAILKSLGSDEELASIRAEMRIWKERKKDLLHRRNLLEGDIRKVDRECQELERKLESTQRELREAQQRLARLKAAHKEKVQLYGELLHRLQEEEKALARLDEEERETQREKDERQGHLNRYEVLLNQARLQREKARDELVALRKRIQDEFGLVEFSPQGPLGVQRPLPFGQADGVLPVVKTPPPNLEGEIKRIKGMLKRLGPVNLEAPEEYRALEGRYNFLKGQIEDLEEGLSRLKAMIADLDREMEKRFMETFQAVDEAFRFYFQELFQGGKARLILSDSDNWEEAGVEIEASPPGKRHRGLSMLSGGEKSLTAVALLFAILKVRPVPFCVLDEVDAMLDEANVGRFCSVLKELAQNIQFIVITHNRGTVEASDTIYGVSMGEDGISQVISMRLDEIIEREGGLR